MTFVAALRSERLAFGSGAINKPVNHPERPREREFPKVPRLKSKPAKVLVCHTTLRFEFAKIPVALADASRGLAGRLSNFAWREGAGACKILDTKAY